MILNELFKNDADLKSVYVCRKVLNKEALRDWARVNGFSTTLPSSDFHVTIVYSKQNFDWNATQPDLNVIYIAPQDDREIHVFDGGATVLHFHDDRLSQRWKDMIRMGASTSYPDYKAHVTITYAGKPDEALPYPGELILGPEEWSEINSGWKEDLVEQPLD